MTSWIPYERHESQGLTERLESLVDWLYPPRCRACGGRIQGADASTFCASCWSEIRLVSHPLCRICGRPFPDASGDDHLCGACLARPPHFALARSWACYPRQENSAHPLRRVVQKFKYGRKVSLGKPLGRLMARGSRDFVTRSRIDLVIPVPLHLRRLRWRGFNQALVLARQVSRLHGIPLDPFILYRRRETPPQTQLTEEERRTNVRGAFMLLPGRSIDNMNLLLVDDVYTSGATVNECSRTLNKGGAKEVYVLTFAHTVF